MILLLFFEDVKKDFYENFYPEKLLPLFNFQFLEHHPHISDERIAWKRHLKFLYYLGAQGFVCDVLFISRYRNNKSWLWTYLLFELARISNP